MSWTARTESIPFLSPTPVRTQHLPYEHDTTDVNPRCEPLLPYALFNALLNELVFKTGTHVRVIDMAPGIGANGLMFALNGGRATSPGASPTLSALYGAYRSNVLLRGAIGLHNGQVCQQPSFGSSVCAKTKVWMSFTNQHHAQVLQEAILHHECVEVSFHDLRSSLPATVIKQTGTRGFGIFAAEPIKKGALVATYSGLLHTNPGMVDQQNTLKVSSNPGSMYVFVH